jgi:hypothetical protein
MRHWLSATLFSRKKIQAITDIIGRHYELVSVLYRLFGCQGASPWLTVRLKAYYGWCMHASPVETITTTTNYDDYNSS